MSACPPPPKDSGQSSQPSQAPGSPSRDLHSGSARVSIPAAKLVLPSFFLRKLRHLESDEEREGPQVDLPLQGKASHGSLPTYRGLLALFSAGLRLMGKPSRLNGATPQNMWVEG